jgi:hypothetical protein
MTNGTQIGFNSFWFKKTEDALFIGFLSFMSVGTILYMIFKINISISEILSIVL